LYVWGQSGPSTSPFQLNVLRKPPGDGDELVRRVDLFVDGLPTLAQQVWMGFGHILVSAVIARNGYPVLFGAGNNGQGQLAQRSLRFFDDFVELRQFRGRKIKQGACAGYSTFLLLEKVDQKREMFERDSSSSDK
jgi:hypothetical protein